MMAGEAASRPGASVCLVVLDGWGLAPDGPGNAISQARTPVMDRLWETFPHARLRTSGPDVGLPEGQMGNSEVGHLNLGAGAIVKQDLLRIDEELGGGGPVTNEVLRRAMGGAERVHLIGLVSDGGVHSSIEHLEALVGLGRELGVPDLVVHAFTDGRDTSPTGGVGYLARVEAWDRARVGTVVGRYYAMDRDRRAERTEAARALLVDGVAAHHVERASDAAREAYERGETDEFITPTVLVDAGGAPLAPIVDGDAVLFFNFRADRVRELCHAFGDAEFTGFATGQRPQLAQLATMTEYEAEFTFPVAFPPVSLTRILGEEVSRHGRRQLRIAETEKYAHVTYFFNGGIEVPFAGEERILINSPRDVATYDEKPQMSAIEVTDTLLRTLAEQEAAGRPFDLVVLNFANGDMVGHTGVLSAAITACETVDTCIGRIETFVRERGGAMLITADHGNAEQMFDPITNGPYTAHTLNPVPCILVSDAHKNVRLREGGALKDLAPTILTLMELPLPAEMEGESLIV
jgi:2,3-bisphosphoglycerate-independent phosphoglycerate mutase